MSKVTTNVRTRFAPSPTGYVHVGSLLTALYDYLIARQNNGAFILRIEDTDQARLVEGSVENLLKVLAWAGISPDEGIILDAKGRVTEKGDYGPYTQSQRLVTYQKYAKELVAKGAAYYCFCSTERLQRLREEQEASKQLTRYDGRCRDLSAEVVAKKLAAGDKYVIRQKIPLTGEITFNDLIRGEVKFPLDSIDEGVLLKSDGFPTYHLAVVVDDHLMKITHVIRAQEWLPSTPKHLLLYQAFGWPLPQFAHMSHLLNKDRTKLSKRKGNVAVEYYIQQGYLPAALINFLVISGWNEGAGSEQEIYSLADLTKKFSFDRVHKTGAIFDLDKLDWLNGVYIRQLPIKQLTELCLPYLRDLGLGTRDSGFIEKVVALEQERLKKLSDLPAQVKYFFADKLNYDPKDLVWKKSTAEATKNNLRDLIAYLEKTKVWDKVGLETEVIKWIGDRGVSNGEVLWPMRFALTGQTKSPSPFEVAEILGQAETLKRLKQALAYLE